MEPRTGPPAWMRGTILAAMVAGFGLRVLHLDGQELRGDEAFGYFFSLPPLAEIVRATQALGEPHPVAGYFVQHVWLGWAGHSEYALRFVSVWWGVLAIALIYRLGRQLDLAPGAAGLAAWLLAVSPYAVWHSQDARMYAISLALTLASTWLAVEGLQRGRWPVWAGYVGVSWLALHTHYYAALVILAQNLFVGMRVLFLPRLRPGAARWFQVQLGLGLLYLPWLLSSGSTLAGYGGNGDSPDLGAALSRSLGAFAVGSSLPLAPRMLAAWLAAGAIGVGLLQLGRAGPAGRRSLGLLLLILWVPILATWYGARERPIFDERYLIAAAPAFYLLAAAGVAGRRPRTTGLVAAGLAGVLLAGMAASLYNHYVDPAYGKSRGWRELAAMLERFTAGLPPGQVRIAQNFPDPTLWYYAGDVPHLVLPPQAQDGEGAGREVAALVDQGVERVLLPVQPAPNWDGAGIAQAALAQEYRLIAEQAVGVWPLQVYARPGLDWEPVDTVFGGGLRLEAAMVQPGVVVPAGVLAVHLRWDGSRASLAGSEKLFLHLVDREGRLVAQTDRPLAAADVLGPAASYGILVGAGVDGGPYRLLAGVYDPGRPGAPRWIREDGSDHVMLAKMPAWE